MALAATLLKPPNPNPINSSSFPNHHHSVARGSWSSSASHVYSPLTVPPLPTHSIGPPNAISQPQLQPSARPTFLCSYHRRFSDDNRGNDDDQADDDSSFEDAVALFNGREYYKCHDVLEALWNRAEEPRRTLIHGVLQCAVGLHHLFNQNHKGAMMELGEGLCKLRKIGFEEGHPFHQFEREISEALEFVYQTQIELAACAEELCIAMNRSERSYQLLGGYGAGQSLYRLQADPSEITYIVFCPETTYGKNEPPLSVKLPTLNATEEHLLQCM